jgi:hypothetical protein
MPRYYFHLCAPDERFDDPEGSEVSDLAEAHSRAVRLADRVMMFGGFAKCQPDLRRWTVEITDERQEPVLTVIFPANFKKTGDIERGLNGAHSLQESVARTEDRKLVPFTSPFRTPAPVSVIQGNEDDRTSSERWSSVPTA